MKLAWSYVRQVRLLSLMAGVGVGFLLLLFPALEVAKVLLMAMGVLVVLNNVFLGLLLVPFTLPFFPNLAFTLLLGLVLGSFVFQLCVNNRSQQLQFVDNPFLYLFLLLLFFSGLTSVTLGYSLREVLLHLLGLAIMLLMQNILVRRSQVKLFLLSLIVASFFVSLYGIYGYVIGVPGETSWVDATLHPGITTRAYSTFGNPNVLAEYLVFIIPFTLALIWYHRGWRQRLFFSGIALIQLLCLVLTLSRSGWVAIAFSLAAFALLVDRRLVWVGIGGCFLLLPFVLQIDVLWVRLISIFSLSDSSNAHRIVVWQETLNMIKEYWATGVGLGHRAFRVVYPYFAFDRTKFPYHSHNTYLQMAVEAGLFGLMALLLYLGSTLKGAVKRIFTQIGHFERCLLVAGVSSLVGMLAFGMFESVLYLPKIIIMFWLVLGLFNTVLSLANSEDSSA
jgi:putative inorganic carbon (HCO3(-)) transporter